MAIHIIKLIEKIEEIAPPKLAESWDNCGIQIDCGKDEIDKILISLEITDEVIEEAISCKADFILSHHPLIFDKLSSVRCNDLTGSYILKLIKNGISVYSAHTTFDFAIGGNNDYLFSLLELSKSCHINSLGGENQEEGASMCRIGDLKEPKSLDEICKLVAEKLKLENPVRTVGKGNQIITTVGLCTGAGGGFLEMAKSVGCDLFITGDLRHHQSLWAKEVGLSVIDAGHYGTEWIFTPNMAKKLREAAKGVEIIESKVNTDPFL